MNEQFGLDQKSIAAIRGVFNQHPGIQQVLLYGSRAKGNFKPGSDIDLTMINSQISFTELLEIENELDDLLLPYKFDISIYEQIGDQKVRAHIDRVGKVFYQQE